ncbi:hypothetical protein MRX96_020616 [Rhipicephalus microplus]
MMPSGLAVRSVPQHQRQQWHLSANGPSMLPRIVEQQAMYLDQWQQTDTMHDAGVRQAAALEMLADNTRWQGEAKQQLADEARHHQVAAVRQAGSLADVQELQGCRRSYRGPPVRHSSSGHQWHKDLCAKCGSSGRAEEGRLLAWPNVGGATILTVSMSRAIHVPGDDVYWPVPHEWRRSSWCLVGVGPRFPTIDQSQGQLVGWATPAFGGPTRSSTRQLHYCTAVFPVDEPVGIPEWALYKGRQPRCAFE